MKKTPSLTLAIVAALCAGYFAVRPHLSPSRVAPPPLAQSTPESPPAPQQGSLASAPPIGKLVGADANSDEPIRPPSQEEIARLIQRAEADGYGFTASEKTISASNGRHGMSAQWSREDGKLRVASLSPKAGWFVELSAPGKVESIAEKDGKLTLKRGAMEEWFVNDASGLEHGFTVPTKPGRAAEEKGFSVAMQLATRLEPRVRDGNRSISFKDDSGEDALHYRGLKVFDAKRKALPASMHLDPGAEAGQWTLAIHVDDSDAEYPLVIDPVFSTRVTTLASFPTHAGDYFGYSVSMSGNMLAVGAYGTDGPEVGDDNFGAVKLFRYDANIKSWITFKHIVASDASANSLFGASVAIDADTLIVGAPAESELASEAGAAYIFRRDAGGPNQWGQVAKLLAPNGATADFFGLSVGLDGGIAAIGAPLRAVGGNLQAGEVYVATRSDAGEWQQPVSLGGYLSSDGDSFGYAVSVSGLRVAASAYVGETPATPANAGMVVIYDLTLDDYGGLEGYSATPINDPNPNANDEFGASLCLEGDTLFVGAPRKDTNDGADAGSVLRFEYDSGSGWGWASDLRPPDGIASERFGASVSFSGDTLVVGSPNYDETPFVDVGAVHVFEKNLQTPALWSYVERIVRSQQESVSRYGMAVAVSGDHFVAGAPLDDSGAAIPDSGTAEAHFRPSAAWRAVSAPTIAGGGETGASVAIDRGTAVVGMPSAGEAVANSGFALVLNANDSGEERWGADIYLASDTPQEGERFGASVAISGNWILVGAPGYDTPGMENRGRAYLFRRSAAFGWTLFKKLEPPNLVAGGEFGAAVALSSRWAVVGAPGMNFVYMFDRYEGGADNWDVTYFQDQSAQGGRFGASVAIDGNQIAVGAPERAGIAPPAVFPPVVPRAGQVMIYQGSVNMGNVVWFQVKALPELELDGSFGTENGFFGTSVAINRGTLMVGEPGFKTDSGRVFLYSQDGPFASDWGELHAITSPGKHSGQRFGESVAIGSRWFFVGSPGRRVGGAPLGQVHTYDRGHLENATIEPTSVLLRPQGGEGDLFGASLAIAGDELISGAPGALNDDSEPDGGAYVIYHRQSWNWGQLGNPTGTLAGTGDQVGYSVAVDGDYMVAGAPYNVVDGFVAAGSVHLFRRNPAVALGWSFVKLMNASDPEAGANFGSSVDIHGDIIAVGAPGWGTGGSVYLFMRATGGLDNWGEVKHLTPGFVTAGDNFGTSVAVHDDLLAVGSPNDDLPALADCGSIHMFVRHKGGISAYGHEDSVNNPFPAAFEFFGDSIDVNDQRILVGIPLDTQLGIAAGAAYVYDRPTGGNTWILNEVLLAGDGQANDRFGTSVSYDGYYAAVGAPGESDAAFSAGAAYVFRDTGGDATTFVQEKKLSAGALESAAVLNNMQFGASLALKGDKLAVGAPNYDIGALVNNGAVYLFERNTAHNDEWGFSKRFVGEGASTTAHMGQSVAIMYDLIVAGAPEAEQGAQTDAGYVFLFGDTQNAYQIWARGQFGDAAVDNDALAASIWGPMADADRDGISNVMEAYMEMDALNAMDAPEARSGVSYDPTRGLIMTWRMGKETNGVVGRIKWSRDLAVWHGGEEPGAEEKTIETRVLEDNADHFILESIISPSELAGEPRLFMRLEIHLP